MNSYMCGRFSLFSDIDEISARFGASAGSLELNPHYNIAPGADCPIIIADAVTEVKVMRWGLVPEWAKDPSIGYKMINARAETIESKPSFKHIIKTRRCIVPCDGFFEWSAAAGAAGRQPWRIKLKSGEIFGLAGLWDSWARPGGDRLDTFTIITTEPNDLIERIHNRMPVILERESEGLWLDKGINDIKILKGLLKPFDPFAMEMFKVSRLVNSTQNDVPECIKEIEE